MTETAHRAPTPIAIGPTNCPLVAGVPWRYVRERYPHLLRPIGPGKQVILAAELEAELRRLGTTLESADVAPVDPVEAARAALGKVRRRSE